MRSLARSNPARLFRYRKRAYSHEVLAYVTTILKLPKTTEGCIVECGCYKGSSTAKFSLAAKYSGRKLVVFDSFEGIPENDERHGKNIFGGPA